MNRRFTRLAAALALALTFAVPTQAMDLGGRMPMTSFARIWSWMEHLWAPAPVVPVKTDRGNGIDPDGATSTPSPLPVENPRGGGIDPNG
jgi:hypothetical protein